MIYMEIPLKPVMGSLSVLLVEITTGESYNNTTAGEYTVCSKYIAKKYKIFIKYTLKSCPRLKDNFFVHYNTIIVHIVV